jgi:hypothetical protein
MGKFSTHDLVKHQKDRHHVFMILDELTSVPPGGPSLYRCMPLHDESKLYKYLETDLLPITLEQAQNDPDVYDLGDYR